MTEDRLKNYAKIKAEHRQLQKRLEDLDDKLYNPPAQHMTGMPHAKQTSSGSSQERLADIKMDLSEIYLSEIHTLVAEEIAIEKAIDRLDPALRQDTCDGVNMTADQLEQYRALVDEIDDLDKRRRKVSRRASTVVSDTVRGSSDTWPYCARTVKITGVAAKHVRSAQRIDQMRRRRQMAARELLSEIEAFMSTIDDARIRRMIDLHYIQGKTWRQVASRVYGSPAYEDAARKATKRFLEK